jgi:hypothetical protein
MVDDYRDHTGGLRNGLFVRFHVWNCTAPWRVVI